MTIIGTLAVNKSIILEFFWDKNSCKVTQLFCICHCNSDAIDLEHSHLNCRFVVAQLFFPVGSVTCSVDTLKFQSSKWNQMGLMRLFSANGAHVYTLVHQLSSVQPQVSKRCRDVPKTSGTVAELVSAHVFREVYIDRR